MKISNSHMTTFKWMVDALDPRYELRYVMGDAFYTSNEEDGDYIYLPLLHGVKVVQV